MTTEFMRQRDVREISENVFGAANAIHDSLNTLSHLNGKVNFVVFLGDMNIENNPQRVIAGEESEDSFLNACDTFFRIKCDLLSGKNIDKEDLERTIIIDNKFIISIDGAGEMSKPIAIGIAYRSKLINYEKAEKLAKENGCREKYAEYEEMLTGFNNSKPISEPPLLPPQDICALLKK